MDLDSTYLSAGDWTGVAVGETLELPAACFFHAGYTERDFGSVVLRKNYEPAEAIVFYGPRLPLDKGKYSAEFMFESPALAGAVLGRFGVLRPGGQEGQSIPVTAGSPAVAAFEWNENKPVNLGFVFLRTADVRIRCVLLTRIE